MCLWGNGVIKHVTSDPNIQVLENLMQFTDRLSQFSLYFLGLNASLVKKCNMVELLSYCSFSDAQAVNKSDVRFRAWQPLSNVEHRNRSEAACCREVPPPLPPSAHPLSLGFVGKVDLCWSPGVPNVVYQTFCTPGHSSYMFIQFTLAFTKKKYKKTPTCLIKCNLSQLCKVVASCDTISRLTATVFLKPHQFIVTFFYTHLLFWSAGVI